MNIEEFRQYQRDHMVGWMEVAESEDPRHKSSSVTLSKYTFGCSACTVARRAELAIHGSLDKVRGYRKCLYCPVVSFRTRDGERAGCLGGDSLYWQWYRCHDTEEARGLARKMAGIPWEYMREYDRA